MVDCLECAENSDNILRITNISYNPSLKEGDTYEINVTVKNTRWLSSIYGRVCLFESGNNIGHSSSFHLDGSESTDIIFRGTMLSEDMHINVSLQQELVGFLEKCHDSRSFIIKIGEYSDPENPDDDLNENYIIYAAIVAIIIILIIFIIKR